MTAAVAPLPAFREVVAPPQWSSVDLISDLHLAEDTPLTFDAWAAYLRETSASAVFILGDLFEVWVGDDARQEGFEARCTQVLADAASRIAIGFMAGNRDFLVGADMLQAAGLLELPDPTVLTAFGQRLLLTHGDALCLEDVEYQQFRSLVRGQAWQREFLALPLAERREQARRIRTASQERQAGRPTGEWFDIDAACALRWMEAADTPTLVHGHTHRPARQALAAGRIREVLTDWDLEGRHGPPRAEVLRLSPAGLERIGTDAARHRSTS